ncbi:MAG: DUF3127 domain-containing protein [Dysgonamonadaceae bacterium]
MQLTARLIQVLPLQTGPSRNGGEWKRQDVVVETDGQYPRKVCISIWGDKANPSVLQPGNILDISFDLESREFNGKWYTSITAWKVDIAAGVSAGEAAPSFQDAGAFPPPPAEPLIGGDDKDDLPF